MISFKYDKEKAVAVLSYISSKLHENRMESGFHSIFKTLYFAEKKHLSKYAMPITGDTYIAMEYGPVPSKSYSLFKRIRNNSPRLSDNEKGLFKVEGWVVTPLQKADMDELSESDICCIDESIQENKALSFGERTDKSHGPAWKKAPKDGEMDFCDIAAEEGASSDVCDLIKLTSENEMFADSI